MPSPKRDRLIDTATRLFNRDGYHATGVDRVIEEAGVARMTLYNHFKSKDELILAVLHRRDEKFRHWFAQAVERPGLDPRERLLAVFDALGEWFGQRDFWGCMFIAASAEYTARDNRIHQAAAAHKRMVRDSIRALAADAGAADPAALADGLTLLVEGAIVMAHVARREDAAIRAREAAEVLIAHAGL